MKSDLKAKFLQHLASKKRDGGFTLIELLVVIIIIGILAAIALPSFLNQANKAKQSEAKTYIGSMNRAQQAYYMEKSNTFAPMTNFGGLGLGVATQTSNYRYNIAGGGQGVSFVTNQAQQVVTVKSPLKGYVGGVAATTQGATSDATTLAVLCEANQAPVGGGLQVIVGTVVTEAVGAPPTCPAVGDGVAGSNPIK